MFILVDKLWFHMLDNLSDGTTLAQRAIGFPCL